MRKLLVICLLNFLLPLSIFAQEVEMADGLRSEGKIYVVVLIMAIIVCGLCGYLYYLDRKVTKLEESSKSK